MHILFLEALILQRLSLKIETRLHITPSFMNFLKLVKTVSAKIILILTQFASYIRVPLYYDPS